jgi:hypothetical protein
MAASAFSARPYGERDGSVNRIQVVEAGACAVQNRTRSQRVSSGLSAEKQSPLRPPSDGSRLKLMASILGSLQADLQAELRDLERAVASGTREAGRGLKSELRRQVASAGLGQRLANSWRDKHYPNHKLDAASLVYSKAP